MGKYKLQSETQFPFEPLSIRVVKRILKQCGIKNYKKAQSINEHVLLLLSLSFPYFPSFKEL